MSNSGPPVIMTAPRLGADGAGVSGQGRGYLRLQQGPLSKLLLAATLGIILVEPSVGDNYSTLENEHFAERIATEP